MSDKKYYVKLKPEVMYYSDYGLGSIQYLEVYLSEYGEFVPAIDGVAFTKSEIAEIKDGMFLKRIPGGTSLDDLGKDKSHYVWIDDCNYWKNPLIELVPMEDGE